jgi:PhnB protein
MAKKKPAARPKAAAKTKPVAKAKAASKTKAAPPAKAAAKAKPAGNRVSPAPAPKAQPAAKGAPAGQHSVTPHLIVRFCAQAIDFYRRAFGAVEVMRMPGPDGFSIGHAEMKIGDSHIYLVDENPGMGNKAPQTLGGTPVSIHLYVEDADAVFKQAVEVGAEVKMPLADMFWGDRFGMVADPFGHQWSIATHKEDVPMAEMAKRAEAFFAKMPKPPS